MLPDLRARFVHPPEGVRDLRPPKAPPPAPTPVAQPDDDEEMTARLTDDEEGTP